MIANAARHEPEAVAALRAGRDDRVNRLLRLPLPEPYVPTRIEALRDRLRSGPQPKAKPEAQARGQGAASRTRPGQGRRGGKTHRRPTRPARRSGHHGGGQRASRHDERSRMEGQRYG